MAEPARPRRRRTITDQDLDKCLDDVLNNRVPVIPEVADLPSWWREAPAEASDRKHPRGLTQGQLVAKYINMAQTQPKAREGLRSLLRELLENGEPVPALLGAWALLQYAQGDPAVLRGRPVEIDQIILVLTSYWLLRDLGYAREDAIFIIAEKMSYA